MNVQKFLKKHGKMAQDLKKSFGHAVLYEGNVIFQKKNQNYKTAKKTANMTKKAKLGKSQQKKYKNALKTMKEKNAQKIRILFLEND